MTALSLAVQTKTMRWLKLLVSMSAVAVLFLGCSSPAANRAGTEKPISVRLQLDQTHVTAGASLRGEVVFTNKTAEPITVPNCPIDGWLQVGLTGQTFHFHPVYSGVGCGSGSIRMNPGVNRYPITVSTSYQSCEPPGSTTRTPSNGCVEPAPLRAGTYRTQVFVTTSRPLFSPAAPLLVYIRPPS